MKRRLDAEVEAYRLHKRLKAMTERDAEKNAAISKLKEGLSTVRNENEKMKAELETYISGEQHLNVIKWSESCSK